MQTAAKAPRVRKVFCRREIEIDGKRMRFELRADGVWLWRRKSRKKKVVTFRDLVTVANGQGLLKL